MNDLVCRPRHEVHCLCTKADSHEIRPQQDAEKGATGRKGDVNAISHKTGGCLILV